MQWTDEGIVLGVRRHGEASGILELMTRGHGRHLGMVRGAFGSRIKPILQPGNGVTASWRARLDEHLGNYTVEALNLRASGYFSASHAIYGVGHLAALMRLLPERDPHAGLYEAFEVLLDHLDEPAWVAPEVVRFELRLLAELGFGLDLTECAATGITEDLSFVSPKSGRAVSREAGRPYADRMLRLP
ncbi:MAG: DNA repair protein RecO, partial [Pseudolabrys sp.]